MTIGDSLEANYSCVSRFSKAAKRVSKLVRKQPFTSAEKLVKWTEFAIDNGGLPELLTEGRQLSFFVFHNLDILLPAVVVVVAVFSLFVCAAIVISRRICGSLALPKKKSKLN